MSINLQSISVVLFTVLLFSCAEKEEQVSVGLADDEGDSKLAEAVFCAGSSEELKTYSSDTYPNIDMWHQIFDDIYANAKAESDELKGADGALVDTRIETIKAQTRAALEGYTLENNSTKFTEFLEQTIQQCNQFKTS